MLDQVTASILNLLITDVSHHDSDITLQLGENRLWVATPWRLEKDRSIHIGNDKLLEYLSHEDYKDDYDSSLEFIKDCLLNASIIEIAYSDFNELLLKLSNGFSFRSFQSYGEDAENFQLYLPGKRFLVYADKVEEEDMGKF